MCVSKTTLRCAKNPAQWYKWSILLGSILEYTERPPIGIIEMWIVHFLSYDHCPKMYSDPRVICAIKAMCECIVTLEMRME